MRYNSYDRERCAQLREVRVESKARTGDTRVLIETPQITLVTFSSVEIPCRYPICGASHRRLYVES